jgi:hypothetical protein
MGCKLRAAIREDFLWDSVKTEDIPIMKISSDVETRLDTTLRSTEGIRQRGGRRPVALTYQQAPYAED